MEMDPAPSTSPTNIAYPLPVLTDLKTRRRRSRCQYCPADPDIALDVAGCSAGTAPQTSLFKLILSGTLPILGIIRDNVF